MAIGSEHTDEQAAKEPPRGDKSENPDYPFRLYGDGAQPWFDGQNFEIQFERGPSAAEERRLASLITKLDPDGQSPCLWSERFLRFFVIHEDFEACFRDLKAFLLAACDVLQIVDVTVVNARTEVFGPWTLWSVEQQEWPDPGPAERRREPPRNTSERWTRAIDERLPRYKPNPRFERFIRQSMR